MWKLAPVLLGHVLPGELVRGRESEGYSRVDVRSRDVTEGGDDDRERDPEREGHRERVVDGRAGRGALQDRRGGDGASREYQDKSADEVGRRRTQHIRPGIAPVQSTCLLPDRASLPTAPARTLARDPVCYLRDP